MRLSSNTLTDVWIQTGYQCETHRQLGHKYADELYSVYIGSGLPLDFFTGLGGTHLL